LAILEPGETPMRGAMGPEVEAPRAPALDPAPVQMLKSIPRIPDIPGVRIPHVIGDRKRGGREAEVREHRVRVRRRRSIEKYGPRAWGLGTRIPQASPCANRRARAPSSGGRRPSGPPE